MRWMLFVGILFVGGCNDMPQARTEAEIREIAREVLRQESSEDHQDIQKLKTDVRNLSERVDGQERLTTAVTKYADAISAGANWCAPVLFSARRSPRLTLSTTPNPRYTAPCSPRLPLLS